VFERKSNCLYCFTQPSKPANTYLYPHDVVLCGKHNMKGMARFIREHDPKDKKECERLVIYYFQRRKKENSDLRQPQLKIDLARRKMASRANVRR
jgi:ferritin